MVQINLSCHSKIRKATLYGHRLKVQNAIKHLILGIFKISH